MATYTVKLTPDVVTSVSEGSLDTSVVNGASIQRTKEVLLVVNGSDMKILHRLKDGSQYDDTTFETVVNNVPAGHPTFSFGNAVIENDNVTVGHPFARQDSGSTV
jgi:hypothetical protein